MEKKIIEIAFILEVATVAEVIANVEVKTLKEFGIKRSDIEKFDTDEMNEKITVMNNELFTLSSHDFRNKYLGNSKNSEKTMDYANGMDSIMSMITF